MVMARAAKGLCPTKPNPHPMPNPYLKFAESLTPEKLELLSEFSDEAEELFCQLMEPKSDKWSELGEEATETRGARGQRKYRLPKHEWTAELAGEVLKGPGKKKPKSKMKLLPAVLSRQEVQVLFDHTKDDPRSHLILRTLYAAGLRRSELSKLLRADLYPDEHKLFIREGKGGKDRYVLVDPTTAEMLDEYTRNHRPQDSIFGISDKTVARTVNAAITETGTKARLAAIGRKFTAHTFRHTYATHMYESGIDTFVLKTLLGHTFLDVTEQYVHIGIGAFKDDYEKAHPLAQD